MSVACCGGLGYLSADPLGPRLWVSCWLWETGRGWACSFLIAVSPTVLECSLYLFCCSHCCVDVTNTFSVCFCPTPMQDICSSVGGLPRMLLFSGKIQEPLLGLISAYLAVGHPSWSCPWRNQHRACPPSILHPYMLCSNN